MGLFDSENETRQVSSIPPYLEAFFRDRITPRLEGMMDRPPPIYPGQRRAGFSPEEEQAFQYAGANAENPEWRPYFGRATEMTEAGSQAYDPSTYDAATYDASLMGPGGNYDPSTLGEHGDFMVGETERLSPEAVDRYMNPYQDRVIDSAVDRINRQGDRQALRDRGRATRAGNLYSAGHGIIDAERDANINREVADTTGRLLDQGYGRATDQFNRDVDRSLTARTGDVGRRLSARGTDMAAQNRAVEFLMSQGLTREQANQAALNQSRATNMGAINQSRSANTTARNRASEFNRTQALAGAREMAGQGTQRQTLRNQDLSTLRGVGQERRGMGQGNLDQAYQDFLEQRDWPLQNLSQISQVAGGQPYTRTQTTNQTTGNSLFNTLAGGALTVGSLFGRNGPFPNTFADGGLVPEIRGPKGPRGPKQKASQTPGRRGGLPPPMLNARKMGRDSFIA